MPQEFAFNVDKRGNRTLVREAKAQGGGSNLVIPADDARVNYYKGEWNTVGNLRTSDTLTAALTIAFFGKDITIELGTGADCGICDVYLDQNLWGSAETYAATAGTISINISAYQLGAHVLDIHNRRAKHPASTGHKLSFKQAEIVGSFYQHTLQHGYDTASRLTQTAYRSGIATTGTPFREYDFTYDVVGNRTNQTVKLSGVTDSSVDYTYNLAEQLITDGVNTYGYDARGNLATINGSPAYTWDRANRLLSYGGSSYSYNGLGQRVSQTIGAAVTEYLQDVQPTLYKFLSATTGANTTRYVHDPMGIHNQQNPDGTWRWMVKDGLSSVRHVVNNNAIIMASAQYTPYGEVWDDLVAAQTDFGFTGEPTDANGLVYLRARHFNPSLGIFLSLDPLGTANRYTYADSNPINFIDPTGTIRENNSIACSPSLQMDKTCHPTPELYCSRLYVEGAADPNEIANYVDCIKSCNAPPPSSCTDFVAEVRLLIEQAREARKSNLIVQVGVEEDVFILDFLAYYYSGLSPTVTRFSIYDPTTYFRRHQGVPGGDRYSLPVWNSNVEDWQHPIYDPMSQLGETYRSEYGFRRPYMQQTHHYFALLKAFHTVLEIFGEIVGIPFMNELEKELIIVN